MFSCTASGTRNVVRNRITDRSPAAQSTVTQHSMLDSMLDMLRLSRSCLCKTHNKLVCTGRDLRTELAGCSPLQQCIGLEHSDGLQATTHVDVALRASPYGKGAGTALSVTLWCPL